MRLYPTGSKVTFPGDSYSTMLMRTRAPALFQSIFHFENRSIFLSLNGINPSNLNKLVLKTSADNQAHTLLAYGKGKLMPQLLFSFAGLGLSDIQVIDCSRYIANLLRTDLVVLCQLQ